MPVPSGSPPALSLHNVTREYAGASERPALRDVSLEVPAGQFLSVVGPSGSGKSTLLDLLAGHARPSSGTVRAHGRPITGPDLDRAVVFQEAALLPWLNVRDNVAFGLRTRGVDKREREEIALYWLDRVGLSHAAYDQPHELSGGMRQRAAIARAFAVRPTILLMDEPFSALDAPTRDRLHVELQELWAATDVTIVFVTHNIREAVALGDRVVVLGHGHTLGEVRVNHPRPRVVESHEVITTAGKVRDLLDTADRMGIDVRPSAQEQGDGYVII